MASHLLDEVEKVCTHVAILKQGNLLLTGPVNEVLLSDDIIEIAANDMNLLERIIAAMPGITKVSRGNNILIVNAGETQSNQ
jgi:ABC-2 type transport system ATP-binding protein